MENLHSKPRSFGRIATLAYLLTLLPVAGGFALSYLETGAFCYALDDSFIMMAISKNLALHGVWGVSPYEFSSAASSPLFTILLAGIIALIGNHIWIPLVVNLIAVFGLFLWLEQKATKWGFLPWQIWFLLMGVSIFAPIHVLIFGSMEHVMHLWISLVCISQVLENEDTTPWYIWILLGVCLSGIRYEGLFLGSGLVLWMWINKRWLPGFLFGTGMMIPVFALGIYSISKGSYFLPNSLMLKAINMNIQKTGSVIGYLYSWVEKVILYPHALVPMILLGTTLRWNKLKTSKTQVWIALALWMSILHFIFGRYHHVYRYEAYLMGISWVILWQFACTELKINNLHDLKNFLFPNLVQSSLVILLAFSPLKRSAESLAVGTRGMVNIYQQQVQMGKFVHQFYNQASLAAIDIGAICYFSDAHLLDVFGLASQMP